MVFKARKKYFDTGKRPVVMGILNVTPDSFSDGGLFTDTDTAIMQCRKMISEGADIIDVGGESSRPGADPVGEELEISRVLPVIKKLRGISDVCISIDTYKPGVAEAALSAGAEIVNNIFGTKNDNDMLDVVAKYSAGICIMHIKGVPMTMQNETVYSDIITDVKKELEHSAELALDHGISSENIVLDPGIGFGKDINGNIELLSRIGELVAAGYNIMIGVSRKSFIANTVGSDMLSRLMGTLAFNVSCLHRGAGIFRVHDVAENRKCLDSAKLLMPGRI